VSNLVEKKGGSHMAGKIAILLDDGFEDLEFFYPYFRCRRTTLSQ